MKKIITSLIALTLFILNAQSQGGDANIWKRYTGEISNSSIPVLPDYSYAGYKLGKEQIPENSGLRIFNITDYGAIANDSKSDQSAIQRAIDAAKSNGGGVVFFPPGEFLVNTDPNNTKSIKITASNIILKGSGSKLSGGTIINMKNHMELPASGNAWETPPMFEFYTDRNLGGSSSITKNATRGDFVIHVKNASTFKNKKYIKLQMGSNNSDANKKYLDNRAPRNIWSNIIKDGVVLTELHEIESVNTSNNTIRLKDPVIDDIKSNQGWKVSNIYLIEGVGFEDIHFKANFLEKFKHHKNFIHDNGWDAISMFEVANSWIRRCKFSNVTNVATMGRSFASSMISLLVEGNSGHGITGVHYESSRILQGLIWDNTPDGQWHGTDFSGRVCGSVAWRIDAPTGRGYDLHANQPRTNLIDMYHSNGLSGAGGNYKNNPNHLTGLTIWNQKREGSNISNYDFWNISCNSNYCGTSVASPIVVGIHGTNTTFKKSSLKYEESNGKKVSPESLYEAQLRHRLGNNPQWVNNTITEYNKLKKDWYDLDGGGDVDVSVTGVSISDTNVTLNVNQTKDLNATVSPNNATNKSVSWSSNNTTIATVDSSGLVTAIAPGSALITVTTQNSNKTATSSVTIKNGSDPDPIENKPPKLDFASLLNGAQFEIGVSLKPVINASDPDGSIANVKLYLDNNLIRQESFAPYEWGHLENKDQELKQMLAGNYTLKAEATDNKGLKAIKSITIKVGQIQQIITTTLSPIQDAYLDNSNRKNVDLIRVEPNRRVGYLLFDTSQINGTITNARLELTCTSDKGNGNIEIQQGNKINWTENNLSNNNKPSSIDVLGNLNQSFKVNSTYTWNLQPPRINNGDTKLALIVVQKNGNDVGFASKENSKIIARPKLVITYQSTGKNDLVDKKVKISPNPFINQFNLELIQNQTYYTVKVININGKTIYEKAIKEKTNNLQINLEYIENGIYFVQLFGENGIENLKIMKK